jgi:hypothetical protein
VAAFVPASGTAAAVSDKEKTLLLLLRLTIVSDIEKAARKREDATSE